MKIMVTGGNGMVGRNLRFLAEKKGHEIIAPGRSELELSHFDAVFQFLKQTQPDVVIHAAGLVGGIQANIAAPYDFCNKNLIIGLNVINAAYQAGIEKLINLGSSCMYPRAAENPLKENTILTGELEPTNEGYAIAKIAVARLAEYISNQYAVHYKTAIPCNLYGYWDKFDVDKSHMIPAVIRKLDDAVKSGAKDVDIWGDGLARREFMFAEDLADFILFVINRFEQVPQNINVGLGFDHSIKEYYETIASVVGYQGSFQHDLSKPAGMKQKLVDVTLQTQLGWTPKTDLRAGLEKTYQFYKEEVI